MPLSWEGEGWNHQVLQSCRSDVGLAKHCLKLSREVLAMALGRLEWSLPGKHLCCELSWSGGKCCCCHWATSTTILKGLPSIKHFIVTRRISSDWTGETWKHDLGLCQLKFCHCRGLVEAALVPVVPLCQALPQRHCWNCRLAVKTGRAANCLWPQGCCSWKYFKYFLSFMRLFLHKAIFGWAGAVLWY